MLASQEIASENQVLQVNNRKRGSAPYKPQNRWLEKTIAKSQHCQRNWDLTQSIPVEDIKTMKTAVTQCSSKQNRVFYKCKFITNRDLIEDIYRETGGAGYFKKGSGKTLEELGLTREQALKMDMAQSRRYPEYWAQKIYDNSDMSTNPQVLGNLLVAFIRDRDPSEGYRTSEERKYGKHLDEKLEHAHDKIDEKVALGIGAGYLTLTANMLGYSSGCCQCGDFEKVSELLGETEPTLLLMGIGYPDITRSRLLHHKSNKRFGSFKKNVLVEDVN